MQQSAGIDSNKISAKPIGGWLWVIFAILVATGLQTLMYIVSTTSELLLDDWEQYFATTDELLTLRLNIYFYLIISMFGTVGIIVWTLLNFFNRARKFSVLFLCLIGYSILTEIIRIYLLDYYAGLTDQDTSTLDTNLAKVGIIGIVAGLYLNKGKRPNQTFVN